jgi:hypothetical protein
MPPMVLPLSNNGELALFVNRHWPGGAVPNAKGQFSGPSSSRMTPFGCKFRQYQILNAGAKPERTGPVYVQRSDFEPRKYPHWRWFGSVPPTGAPPSMIKSLLVLSTAGQGGKRSRRGGVAFVRTAVERNRSVSASMSDSWKDGKQKESKGWKNRM